MNIANFELIMRGVGIIAIVATLAMFSSRAEKAQDLRGRLVMGPGPFGRLENVNCLHQSTCQHCVSVLSFARDLFIEPSMFNCCC